MRVGSRLILIVPLLAAVVSAAAADLEERLARADSLLQRHEADRAAAILDSLRESAEARVPRDRLTVLLAQARLNGLVGRPGPGRESAAAALDLATALGDTLATCRALRWLAVAAQQEGSMPEARVCAQRLLDLARSRGDRFHEGQGLLLLAFGDSRTGNVAAAEPEYEAAIRAFAEIRNLVFELMALQGLGHIWQGRGEIDGARRCYVRVLEGSRELGDPYGEARALNDLGVLEHVHGDPSAAVAYYQRALDLQVSNGDLVESVNSATNLAITHSSMGEYEEALALLTRTLRRCEEAGFRGLQASVLEEMGLVHRDQARYREAATLFRQAADLAAASPPDELAHNLVGLAEVLALQDSAAAGLVILQEALGRIRGLLGRGTLFDVERTRGSLLLKLNRPAHALVHLREAERISRSMGLRFLVGLLVDASRCHDLLGRPDSARIVLQRAAQTWETERARLRDPGWREQLENNGRRLYTEIARGILADSAAVPTGERAQAAFDALQRFKARTLHERMLGAFGEPPEPASRAGEAAEPIAAAVTLAELQDRWLGGDELLLDFFLGDDGIYLFGVTRSECRAVRVACDPMELRRALLRYRELVATRPAPPPLRVAPAQNDPARLLDAAGRRLSSLVLGPVADLLEAHPCVILALDGELNLAPVEAWPSPFRMEAIDPPRPLFARRGITRIPSATLLRDQRARAQRAPPAAHALETLAILGTESADHAARREAGASPQTSGRSSARGGRLSSLPGAVDEVRWLRRSFRNVRVFCAEDSARWAGVLARCDVLHLASHVRVDDVHPWRSGLPRLRAQQVAGRCLPARLVFLAGCESAGGRLVSGEGVLGLTSAFISASVPSVVATLWPVSDRATARLTRAFYGALADGHPAGEALRMAQGAVRAHPPTSHPFYWAGFVLVGEDGTDVLLVRKRTTPILLALAAAATLAFCGFGLARRQKRGLTL